MALFTKIGDHRGDPMNLTSAHVGMIVKGGILATIVATSTTTVLQLDSTVGMKAGDTIIAQLTATTQDATGKTITSVDGPHQITLSGALSGIPPVGAAICDTSFTSVTPTGSGYLRAVKWVAATANGADSAVLKDPVSGRILWCDDGNAQSSSSVTYSTVLEEVNAPFKTGVKVDQLDSGQLLVWFGTDQVA